MAYSEDLNAFFGDFSENVFYDNATYKGILEQPDEIVADDRVLTTDYQLTVKTSDFGSLAYDTQIEVSNVKYKVRSSRKIDDGTLSVISLMKV
jgi:hypothetical protein|tara:strand:- start:160 stop:438 length:279 start_codon:yes stop_codon:yes gene_type:complete